MKVRVHTILTFARILGDRDVEITLAPGSTVQDLLLKMKERWGEALSPHLFQPGTVVPLPHIVVMVNGRSIRFLRGLETELREGDEVLLFPPVAGG